VRSSQLDLSDMATLQVKAFASPFTSRRCSTRPACRPAIRINLAGPHRGSCRSGSYGWGSAQDFAKAAGYRSGSWGGGFTFPGGGIWTSVDKKSFEEFMKEMERCMNTDGTCGQPHARASASQQQPSLPLDVTQDDTKYVLYADVPGLAKSDLSIKLSKENVLTISGTRQQLLTPEEGEAGTSVLLQQRPSGTFERKWELPEDVDAAAISAKVSEGVLTITLGKKVPEPQQPDDEGQDIPWV